MRTNDICIRDGCHTELCNLLIQELTAKPSLQVQPRFVAVQETLEINKSKTGNTTLGRSDTLTEAVGMGDKRCQTTTLRCRYKSEHALCPFGEYSHTQKTGF
jgi:hypothetical protein